MDSFSHSYAEARQKFMTAAQALGLNVQAMLHPMLGPEQEELATDVAVLGDPNARRALYVTTGVHGVEGYYGSGVLVQWLRDNWQPPAGIKVVLVHACNPYGFAWGRRFTEENVDLNRNFWPLEQPTDQVNEAYARIQHLVEYPGVDATTFTRCQQQREAYLDEEGIDGLKIALSGGQQQSPSGLFFIGTEPTWARRTYEALVSQHTQGCTHVFFLDLHTGLGPRGYADFLHQYADGSAELATLERYIGGRVLGDERDEATAQGLESTTITCFNRCAEAAGFEVLGGAIECGTTPLDETLEALLQESALHRYGCDDEALAAQIRQKLKDVFYVDADDWKQQVYEQTCEIRERAISYLGSFPV